jgi:GNAT superfamily N-acetyltransferase
VTLTLRPPRPDEDLFALELAARELELTALQLPPAVAEPFVRMQARAQRQGYAATWPELRDRVMEFDGEVAGRVILHRDAARLLVIDLVVLPAFRRRGLTREVLDQCKQEATEHGVPVESSMLAETRHLQTFLHLGFHVVGERPPHILLRWDPGGAT